MKRMIPMLVGFAFIIGCAGTTNRPPSALPASTDEVSPPPTAPAEAENPVVEPASVAPERLTANLPQGWRATEFSGGALGVVNPSTRAQIVFAILGTDMTPLEAVQDLRQSLTGTDGVVMEEIQSVPGSGIVTWRYTRQLPDVGSIQGTIMARPSNIAGYGVMAMGLWPADQDDEMLTHFAMIAASIQLQ